jgi:hypothetical protein
MSLVGYTSKNKIQDAGFIDRTLAWICRWIWITNILGMEALDVWSMSCLLLLLI